MKAENEVQHSDAVQCVWLPHLHFDTCDFDDRDRLDALNTFSRGLYTYSPCVCSGFVPQLDLDAWALEDIAAASVSHGPVDIQCSEQLDTNFEEMVFLRWVRTGKIRVACSEQIKEFGPGSLFLMQSRHRLTAVDSGASLSLRLPFARVGYDPTRHPPLMELCRDKWQVRVLASAIEALFETLPGLSLAEVPSITLQLAGLVRAVIASEYPDDESAVALKVIRGESMRRYLVDNLSRADLGVSHLQSEFNASRATVYRAFDDVGGVACFVRDQRLAAIHRDLRHAIPARGIIRQIAERHGLYDQTSFLRMFRAEYGLRPSDILGAAHAVPMDQVVSDKHIAELPSLASFWASRA